MLKFNSKTIAKLVEARHMFVPFPVQDLDFQCHILLSFCVELFEVRVVRFVNIGRIAEHNSLVLL